jgi:hypothetical protein
MLAKGWGDWKVQSQDNELLSSYGARLRTGRIRFRVQPILYVKKGLNKAGNPKLGDDFLIS